MIGGNDRVATGTRSIEKLPSGATIGRTNEGGVGHLVRIIGISLPVQIPCLNDSDLGSRQGYSDLDPGIYLGRCGQR